MRDCAVAVHCRLRGSEEINAREKYWNDVQRKE